MRRDVLKTTGGALAGVGATGLAAARPDDRVRVNLGYRAKSGRQAALDAADDVRHDFDFDAVSLELPKRAATALENRTDVRYVEEDGTMQALAETYPWGIDRVDVEEATADGYDGDYGHIAIIDTGIDPNHPDLNNNVGSGRSFVNGSNWYDDNGHGTHCAGIAAAENNNFGVLGVASSSTLHAVKVLNSNGSGYYSDIAAGIEYTANQGWDVGSLSLGGGASQVVKDACSYAYNNGVFLAAAAGNDGCYDCVGYPAAYGECVAVSSTNSNDNISSFSSTGPEVELAAPGSSIYSTYWNDTYATLSGTSMATPHVAGAASILMGEWGYSNTQARNRLNNTAEDIGLPAYQQGYGLLDVAAAVNSPTRDN